MTGCGEGTLPAALTAGVCRGEQPQALHQWSGGIDACEVSPCSHGGDGHDALDATQRLERCDDRMYTPGLGLVLECWFQTPEAFRVFVDRAPVVLQDELLGGGVTDHRREPSEMGRTPIGLVGIAEIVPEQEGFQAKCRGLESTQGIFAGAGAIAQGFTCCLGDIDGGESTRAHQPGQLYGLSSGRLPAVTSLFRHEAGRHPPAVVAFFAQIAIKPGATWPRFVDKAQLCGLGWPGSDELVHVTLAGTEGAEGADLGVVVFGDVGHGTRVCVDIHSDVKRARLVHG